MAIWFALTTVCSVFKNAFEGFLDWCVASIRTSDNVYFCSLCLNLMLTLALFFALVSQGEHFPVGCRDRYTNLKQILTKKKTL